MTPNGQNSPSSSTLCTQTRLSWIGRSIQSSAVGGTVYSGGRTSHLLASSETNDMDGCLRTSARLQNRTSHDFSYRVCGLFYYVHPHETVNPLPPLKSMEAAVGPLLGMDTIVSIR